jgi:hypothetical protein
MARRLDEGEWDDGSDSVDEGGLTEPCPYCGKEVYEGAPRCPSCGQYISDEDAPPARKPWWLVLGVVVCLYVVYRWIAG